MKGAMKNLITFLIVMVMIHVPLSVYADDMEAINLYERGRFEIEDGAYEEGLKFIEEALKLKPGDVNFMVAKGQALIKLDRIDEAETLFNSMLGMGGEARGAACIELGSLYSQRRQYTKAAEFYGEAIKVLPGRGDLYLARGGMYLELKEYDKALVDFKEAGEVNPDLDVASRYHVGITLYRQDQLDEAGSVLDEALTLEPTSAEKQQIQSLKSAIARDKKMQKPVALSVNVFTQYDDNLTNNPSDPNVAGVTDQSDYSMGFVADGRFFLYNNKTGSAGARVNVRAQFYDEHNENDTFSHTWGLFYTLNQNPWYFRVSADAGYYYADREHDLTMYSISPSVVRLIGDDGRLELLGSYERKNRHTTEENSNRYVLGTNYYHNLAPGPAGAPVGFIGRFGFQIETEQYDGQLGSSYWLYELKSGLTFPLPAQFEADFGIGYAWIDYDRNDNLFSGLERNDKRITFQAKAGRAFTESTRMDLFYVHTFNNSDYSTGLYDFNRNVYTLMFSGAF